MNNIEAPIESLFEKAEDYGKITVELFKLNAINKTTDIVSTLAVQLVMFILFALLTLSINIGIALWIGHCLGRLFYGFFIVAAFYVIIIFFVYAFRIQWIKSPIRNNLIKQLLESKV